MPGYKTFEFIRYSDGVPAKARKKKNESGVIPNPSFVVLPLHTGRVGDNTVFQNLSFNSELKCYDSFDFFHDCRLVIFAIAADITGGGSCDLENSLRSRDKSSDTSS